MKKIIVFTSTRAEYGLLRNLIFKLVNNEDFTVKILVTGTHLSKKYGLTKNEIYEDGFKNIIDKVSIPISSKNVISELTGMFIKKFSTYLKSNIYDLAIILGDRFEAFAMASACFLNNIEIAHIHGGEVSEGAIDNKLRHCITLMSTFHFTSHKNHLLKVASLEAIKKKSYITGPMIIDTLNNIKLYSRNDFTKQTNYEFNKYNFLITYHPVTKQKDLGIMQFMNLLKVLDDLMNNEKMPINILFTYPNFDEGNEEIINNIKKFNRKNLQNTFVFESLGQQKYLSALKLFNLILGNSSSGIIEAGFFDIKVLNIGDRQKGRTRFGEVIDSKGTKKDLKNKIKKMLSKNDKKIDKRLIKNNKIISPSDIILKAIH